MKPSAYLYLFTRRLKKNGKYPVKVRVVFCREYHDYRTKLDLTETEFEEASKQKPPKELRKVAEDITSLKNQVNTILDDLKIFTFKKFEDAFYGKKKSLSDLYDIYREYIDLAKQEGRQKTAVAYLTAMNSLHEFKPRLRIHDIDHRFLAEYHQWMINKGKSITTVGIYLRVLRAVYNYAASEGLIKKDEYYPFGRRRYIIPAGRNRKRALTIEQVGKIFNSKLIPGTPADRARDFWIFSYLCNGINFKDISVLRVQNLQGDMLRFIREKTRRTSQGNQHVISCYLPDQAKAIILKWGTGSKDPNDYLFDINKPSDEPKQIMRNVAQFIKNTNKYMKRIAADLEIEFEISTYYARHSFSTILKRSGASISQISEALGHANEKTTQSYLDSFDDESKKELSKALLNF